MTTIATADLKTEIEAAWEARDGVSTATKGPVRTAVEETLRLLDQGKLRVAERQDDGRWLVHQKAAETHKTAFANHLWMNYEGRLHVLLQTPPYELHTRKHRVEILNAVMGRQTRPGEGDPQFAWQSNPPLLELIRTERERFTVPEADRNWRGPRRALTDGEAITEVTLKVRT